MPVRLIRIMLLPNSRPHLGVATRTQKLTYSSSPFSTGKLSLPYQRPALPCRTFTSPLVEKVIKDVTSRLIDKDLARLFENAFPNTLDTTISWHDDGLSIRRAPKTIKSQEYEPAWEGPQTFCVTGDINAEWLRDSTNQLAQYQALASKDPAIFKLLLGAIATQAEYVIESPYCNAFQPPPPSALPPTSNGQGDTVHPAYDEGRVFECKYELDSLAHFLSTHLDVRGGKIMLTLQQRLEISSTSTPNLPSI